VALTGVSGAGKSSLMRMIYGNYLCGGGSIRVRHGDGWVDIATAAPREIAALRRSSLGYVSQFLRVIPRVPTLDVVGEPLVALGAPREPPARAQPPCWSGSTSAARCGTLSPTTFSGGEQQRVNIARGFAHPYPALLLDEPTASLDAENRAVVLDLIREAKAGGAAILGIFHDAAAREAVCDRSFALPGRAAA
jgi:alpha-D-ribose 1-methylphosphonate 5-triphosphate synthase subunit PhnL